VDELAALREDYRRGRLDEGDVDPDPLVQLRVWLAEAIAAQVPEPTAMVLATVDGAGRPATRTVLCKGIDERGLRFFTNRRSRKGTHLAASPPCAATFLWKELERQVGVTGTARTLADIESDAYFASRPRGSQLGAWASPQSEVVAGRRTLEDVLADLERRWPPGSAIPRPPHWGGYLLVPDTLEVWQGRPSRLHDRLRYRRQAEAWVVERLAP
jgi:pyridoxamine 5'-phosphate oxidase